MDDRRFVEDLIAALPEAFAEPGDRDRQLADPLPYTALGQARIWIEEHALKIRRLTRRATVVRPERVDAMRRFWDFVEAQAVRGKGDSALETLLMLECFEGVVWLDDVSGYLGPATRALRGQ